MSEDAVFSLIASMAGIQVGIVISSFLFGILTLQAFFYFPSYPNDRMFLKLLASSTHLLKWPYVFITSVVWFLELFGMVFAGHLLYAAAISPYRENPLLMFTKAPYQVNAIILVSNWSGAIVQFYFVDRVRRFTQSLWVPALCWVIIGYTIASVIALTVVSVRGGILEYTLHWRWLSISGLFTAAAVDIIVSFFLCGSLMKQRKSPFPRSTRLIDEIILMTVTTGVLTSLVATASAILLVTMPFSMIYFGVYICLARIYANSYFASLNARNRLRGSEEDGIMGSVRFASRSAAAETERSKEISETGTLPSA
ncbi:hypothetical protein EYR40_009530 [Pleurotus pulmonarius]|nr:hypothetical protein EYR38_009370 [Pleurotus pulmonarius]KAF4590933.1 hypothetical protein EYR40_009530 [Pleurotus pulmonarius]